MSSDETAAVLVGPARAAQDAIAQTATDAQGLAAGAQAGVSDIASATPGKGAALVGMGQANLHDRLTSISVSILEYGASGALDCLAAFNLALAAVKAAGGGTIVFPYQGLGGWRISDTATIDASNIHISLHDNVILTKTTKSSAFLFTGASRTSRLSNVSISGVGGVRQVDGNGRNVSAYSYSTKDSFYSALLFRWCDNWSATKVYGYSGLVNCLRAFQCGPGEFTDCQASDAVFDNGITVEFDPGSTWSDTDPTTWSNAKIVRGSAWNCSRGFGISSYAATGVVIDSPTVWSCGNDDPAHVVSGGGISVEGDYFSPGTDQRNRRVRIIQPKVNYCWNAGLFVSARGVQALSPSVANTRAPVKRTSAAGELGANIFVTGSGTLELVKGRSTGGVHGVCSLGTSFTFSATLTRNSPTITVSGLSTGSMAPGGVLVGTGIPGRSTVNGGTKIIDGPSGGGNGTYTMSAAATVDGTQTITATFVPSVQCDMPISGPSQYGIYGRGYEDFIVSQGTIIEYCGSLGAYFNSAGGDSYLQQGNYLHFAPAKVFRCNDRALRVAYGGRIIVADIFTESNRLTAGQGALIRIENSIDVVVRNIRNRDPNVLTSQIVLIDAGCTNGQAFNISGDKAAASNRISNSATNILTGDNG